MSVFTNMLLDYEVVRCVYTELMKYTGDLLIKHLQKKVKALEGTSLTSQWQLFRPEAGSY